MNNFISYLIEAKTFIGFPYKQENRDAEFTAIRSNIPVKPTLNIISLPAEYGFERRFVKTFKKNLNVWVFEKGYSTIHAKQFIRDFPNSKVYLPIKEHASEVYIPRTTSLVDIFNIDTMMFGRVNFSAFHVEQTPVRPPQYHKYDLIDLDYLSNLHPTNWGQILFSYNELLSPGGLLFITLNLTEQRTAYLTKNAMRDLDEDTFKHIETQRILQRKVKKIVYSPNNNIIQMGLTKYGAERYMPITNGIIDLLFEHLNKYPIYANLYRGGDNMRGGTFMRLVYKKG